MMNLAVFYTEYAEDQNYFPDEFDWLKSDFSDDDWLIQFGGSGKVHKVHFDVVISSMVSLKDDTSLKLDLKRLIALVAQFSKSKPQLFGLLGNSRGRGYASGSSIKNLLGDLCRIHRTIRYLGYDSLSEVKAIHLPEIIKLLSKKEVIGLEYLERLYSYEREELEANQDLSCIPVRLIKSKRTRSSVDWSKINYKLGFSKGAIKTDATFKNARDKINVKVGSLYPEYKWEEPKSRKDNNDTELLSQKRFKDAVTALKLLIAVSSIEGLMSDVFEFSLDDFDESYFLRLLALSPSSIESSRTSNIEVDDFLRLLDGCVRWVTHYSNDLFDLESQVDLIKEKYSNIKSSNRLVAAEIKSITQNSIWVGAMASPFPLNGINNARSRNSNSINRFEESEYLEIKKAVKRGLTAGRIKSELLPNHDRYSIQNAVGRIKYRNEHLDSSGIGLDYALYTILPLCCKVILLAFTAGREESIDCLEAGCISEDRHMKYIRMYIPKTGLGWQKLPAVQIHRLAVDTLERLSASYRERTGESTLFKFDSSPLGIKGRGLDWDYNITTLVKLCDVDSDGFDTILNEHMFRRFFAIMYFYRYEIDSDFEALSYYLRHISYEMTSVYLTEKEAGRILKQVQAEKVQRYARKVVNNDPDVGGGFVATLREEFINRLGVIDKSEINDVELMFEDEEDAYLFDFTSNGDICFGRTPRFKDRSKCKVTDDEGLDHLALYKASDSLCAGCSNQLCVSQIKNNMITHQHEKLIFSTTRVLDAAFAKQRIDL
ncbi:hypothetical protein ABFY09_12825 [Marinomonas sp. 5E14-1]|uniref:hypothetical protein n=1 Tax=Marinomonas sp. 5E14-1 TaxID=3153922 RepID=UPI0032639209